MSKQHTSGLSPLVQALLDRGVVLPCPASVEVVPDLDPERVAPGVVIHGGCRLAGERTSIGPGCTLGAEAPATVENCCLGHGVALKGGFFSGSVFLDGSAMGSSAHVRAGTLLEEQASGAHAVGFKQTILMSFVVTGSLVNFCDCLMAGGTGPHDHGEVGSSYVHFNFTPHGDKATASLIGDVPRGVMLDQPPAFLGGQGGLVGPSRIEFGCILPAGVICREDVLSPGRLWIPRQPRRAGSLPFRRGVYARPERVIRNNLVYIGNLRALQAWYRFARQRSAGGDPWREACRLGALELLDGAVAERLLHLEDLADRLAESARRLAGGADRESMPAAARFQEAFAGQWPALRSALKQGRDFAGDDRERESFLAGWNRTVPGEGHTASVRALDPETRRAGTAWLQKIADAPIDLAAPGVRAPVG